MSPAAMSGGAAELTRVAQQRRGQQEAESRADGEQDADEPASVARIGVGLGGEAVGDLPLACDRERGRAPSGRHSRLRRRRGMLLGGRRAGVRLDAAELGGDAAEIAGDARRSRARRRRSRARRRRSRARRRRSRSPATQQIAAATVEPSESAGRLEQMVARFTLA
jgi:hypothetical protein